MLNVFEELGCYKDTFGFLPAKKILVISSDGMWTALAPKTSNYDSERTDFVRALKDGFDFFNLGKEDGVVLVKTDEMEFDWSKLTDKTFVELCRDIITSFPQIIEANITEGTGDLGQDIEAFERITSLVGDRREKWTIQCKHYPSRKIAKDDICSILNSHAQLKFDVFCLMATNLLLPSTRTMLDAWGSGDYHFKVVIWDKPRIEDHLRKDFKQYARYFGR